jgi:hypothetical protein
MDLGELIDLLKTTAPQRFPIGLAHPHSWRGDFCELAFEPCKDTTTDNMLCAAVAAVGAVYQGYKGGHYEMTRRTPINIEKHGDYTDGGAACAIIRELDPGRDTEGRTLEWLTRKAVDLILANGRPLP